MSNFSTFVFHLNVPKFVNRLVAKSDFTKNSRQHYDIFDSLQTTFVSIANQDAKLYMGGSITLENDKSTSCRSCKPLESCQKCAKNYFIC